MAASTASSAVTASASRRLRPKRLRPPERVAAPISTVPERRGALLGAKLGALVGDHWPASGPASKRRITTFGSGAGLVHGDTGWALIDTDPHRAIGPALAWGRQAGVADLHVLVEPAAKSTTDSADSIDQVGGAARRASAFERAPTVWRIDGRTLSEAAATPYPSTRVPAPEALAAAEVLREAGVDVIVEHGDVLGEILGLEMARVIVDEHGARVEVGVGRHDREAFAMLHGDVPTAAALASVVDTVRRHRSPSSPPHPLNRLASERWLRGLVIAEPGLVGAVELSPVEPTTARISVKDAAPAAAVGVDAVGRSVVVVCSTGIDLDLVPAAADIRLGHAPDARLVLVVPERDAHPVTRALAAALRHPAEVVLAPAAGRR